MARTMIIPDVHGRTFWLNAFNQNIDKVDHVVFLGDYLDPYQEEGVTQKEAFEMFLDIIEIKKKYGQKVILLLGNHDCSYVFSDFSKCRHDYLKGREIRTIFNDNIGLFQLAWEEKRGRKRYLYTHSGLIKSFIERHKDVIKDTSSDSLNTILHEKDASSILDEVSFYRGGFDESGSLVWSDVREMGRQSEEDMIANTYQIFGHTMLMGKPIIKDNWACLDCQKVFVLEKDGALSAI